MTAFCTGCVSSFLQGTNLQVILISWMISIVFLLLLRWQKETSIKRKLIFMYGHLFGLLFPFLFFIFYQGCETLFSGCNGSWKAGALFVLTAGVSWCLGALLSPILFVRNYAKRSKQYPDTHTARFAHRMAKHLSLRLPKICFVDSEKPFAFSLYYRKPTIFISIGLNGLLTRKEAEAVVLHELYHLRSRTSVYKLSVRLVYLFSPISRLACFYRDLNEEEHKADRFSVKIQQTSRYLKEAKKKIRAFYKR